MRARLQAVALRSREGLIEQLPVRAKKVAVRTRYFHYLLTVQDGMLWIHQREGKDVWRGLYEPFLIEAAAALDRKSLVSCTEVQALRLQDAPEYEGELSQRLTHQLIHSRFFSVAITSAKPAMPDGVWVPLSSLKDYAFPRSLIIFFEKKGYF